jgi:hypothetical protein
MHGMLQTMWNCEIVQERTPAARGTARLCKKEPLPLGEVNFELMEGFEYSMAEWMAYL